MIISPANVNLVNYGSPVRWNLGVWLMMLLILMKSYSGIFYSALTFPEFETTIETMDDLLSAAINKDHTILTIASSAYHNIFVQSQCCGPYYTIGRAMNDSAIPLPDSVEEAMEIFNENQDKDLIYIGVQRTANDAMRQLSQFKLHFSSDQLMNDQTGMALAKQSRLLPSVNLMQVY